MIQRLDLRPLPSSRAELLAAVPRAAVEISSATETVAALIAEVRENGAAALAEQAKRFDGAAPKSIRVEDDEIKSAVAALPTPVRSALEEAIERVRTASAAQKPTPAITSFGPGAVVEQRWQPVTRAGLYIPGGKAVYPSSVVMNVVPAQVAGVDSIAVASPPQREFGGRVHPTVLGALGLLGVDEVYAMGGAGAVAALAYGVPELGLAAVDVITGPGNVYVASAKRLVQGGVGIDAEAGATEILIIADAAANADLVAADLISQAEHDELAAAVLLTDSAELIGRVEQALERQLPHTTNAARAAASLSGAQSALVLVESLSDAATLSNAYGPEHLALQVADAEALLSQIENAGAIFIGPYSPVSLGDYLAGSNHVLPTGGQARFGAGLGVVSFLRSQQLIRYQREGLAAVAGHIDALSEAEHLPAHGEAVNIRFRSGGAEHPLSL